MENLDIDENQCAYLFECQESKRVRYYLDRCEHCLTAEKFKRTEIEKAIEKVVT